MSAKSARHSAVADTRSRPALASAAISRRLRKKCSPRFAMKSTAEIDAVLLVDKARCMTSHDVVALVRRKLGFKKVGHCGTLDPLATGLLIVVLGRGTKIQDLLMSEDKEYVGTLTLGLTTDSQDADGHIVATKLGAAFSRVHVETALIEVDGDLF